VFHAIADTGGVKNPDFQMGVASAMKNDLHLAAGQAPLFCYHVGDVVYFNGEVNEYGNQFYEPYFHYTPPIIGIPGNHDGDPIDANQTSLDGWVRYFMSPTTQVLPEATGAERTTLSLPNVFFTLNAPFATFVGLYTNVPEHGSVDSIQQQWLTNEFATAPSDKALIVALHHPVYSFDSFHSGSPRMADVLQHAINDSRRVPNIVLTGHVHNYQRIEREIIPGTKTPFLVLGHGGYHNMHHLNADIGATDPDTQATLIAADEKRHGYLTITLTEKTISGTATATDPPTEDPTPGVDTFSYTSKALTLSTGIVVSL
jgi:hypothetical protein